MASPKPDISGGLDRDEFFPVFQPLVELRTGQLAGFEVLARWRPHGAAIVMPDNFIPAAEHAGLIQPLCESIFRKAVAVPGIVQSKIILSINISAVQLADPDLPSRIESMAAAAGFPLDRLTIEITESALLDDLPRAAAVAHAIKALRCRLALDDFGTGYSSLRHLHALPFDELKVDRSFVLTMTEKRESRKIVASVVGLGQSLGLMTAAEGIETPEQAEMLLWLGCDLGQGWLFGKPVTADGLPAILAETPENRAAAAIPVHDGSPVLFLDPVPAHRVAQLQAIYDGAPVGLCFLDRNMRYVNLNRQLAQMNQVPAAAHIGRTVAEVIPVVFPHVEPFIRRALEGEPVNGVEVTKPLVEPSTVPQTVMLFYHPVRDEAGDVLGVSVAVMDVTERKRTEAALRESEDHFRHMIRLGPHVPWVLDNRGEVVEASPRWTDFTGQSMDEAMGSGWTKMLHPDDVTHTVAAIHATLESGAPIDIEYRVRRPGENWKRMRSRGAPRFNSSGQVVSVYGVVEEVEGQKLVSEELAICEAELRSAVEAVPVGIVLASASDGAIFTVNPRAQKTFGNRIYPGQTLADYSRMGLLDTAGRPISNQDHPLARSIQRGVTTESRPCLFHRPGGILAHLSVSSRPIRSDEGIMVGGIMLIHDPEGES